MTPEQRLPKVFDLAGITRDLFRQGLTRDFPDLSELELHRVYLQRG